MRPLVVDSGPIRVLVLGGAGFIGRHVVDALTAHGCQVLIGSRDPRRQQQGGKGGEYRQVRFEHMLDADDWMPALDGCAAVINCVGILRPRGHETYERVHHHAPAALAAACKARSLRLVHVSILGWDAPVRSGFVHSKRAGEAALRDSGADVCIVRPSLIDGEGGFGARWIRRVARWPVQPVPRAAIGRIAVLDARDLGEAIAKLAFLSLPAHESREFELGGQSPRSMAEHLLAMRRLYTMKSALQVPIPNWFARLTSHVCDLLHVTPFSFGHWELLQHDNCPQYNRLPELLGRAPRQVGTTMTPPASTEPLAGMRGSESVP